MTKYEGLHGRALLRAVAANTLPGGREGECWDWQGGFSRDRRGRKAYPYAAFGPRGAVRHVGVHRATYEAAYGPIPPGEAIHHKCSRRQCVRPEHLQAVSAYENTAEMATRIGLERRIAYLEAALARLLTDNHEHDDNHTEDDDYAA